MDTRLELDEAILHGTPLLDDQECAEVVQTLFSLREHWTRRGLDFFTLGVNSYQDHFPSPDPGSTYFDASRLTNLLLKQHFGWLLDRVRLHIEEELQCRSQFDDSLALPGFHIFLHEGIPVKNSASVHFDQQYEAFAGRLYDPDADAEPQTVSFTLPLELPANGGGLNYWPFSVAALESKTADAEADDSPDLGLRTRGRFYPYTIGHVVLHSGKILHQIAGVTPILATDRRVTLQGHGILREGVVWLYW